MAACMRNVTFLSRSLEKSCVLHGNCTHHAGFSRNLHIVSRKGLSYRQQQFFLKQEQKYLQSITTRCISTEGKNLPFGYIPDVPIAPLEDIKTMLPELNALGEPTLQSMGLGSNSPVGLVQQCMEMLHVGVDLPWWGAIALTALTLKILTFPFVIYSRKHGVAFRNHLPTVTRLQEKLNEAKLAGDENEWSRRNKELMEYMNRNDIKLRRVFLTPMIQMPILITVYYAIRSMSLLPVESLKTGGILWFADLTAADPFLVLPAVTAITVLAMIEFGAESQRASDLSHGMKWAMRAMPVMVFCFTYKFAAGITLYWTVSNIISLITLQILKIKKVRAVFDIPEDIVHKKTAVKNKKFVEGFNEMLENYRLKAETNKRKDVDNMTFKKAGTGPVPKTYRHNPLTTSEKKKASASG
ncbi:Mitochondrial inner membrane protein oxa1l [Mactra antiquata]